MLKDITSAPTSTTSNQGFAIPVFKPSYNGEESEAVRECLEKGWTGCGPKVLEFEHAFAKYVGVPYAVATNSCTASLHLALKLLNVEGAEILTTPITFVSTNHAILYNDGIPVFVDVEEDTLNIDAEKIEACITPKTKGIVTVHFGGHACNMDKIFEIAAKHKLWVLEDAAHACGGEYRGKKLGSLGILGCYSFHAVKNLATGDGGMIVTDNRNFYDRLMKLRWVGITRDTWRRADTGKYSWDYDIEELGYKYQMNDIAAAIGLIQLKKLDEMNHKRAEIARAYDQAFVATPQIQPLKTYSYAKRSHHNYVIRTDRRDELMNYLKERGVATGVHYRPNNHYPMYQDARHETPVSERVWKTLVTLPLYPDMTIEQRDHVIGSVLSFFSR